MPLDDPDHRITDRVAEPDTHPESEVGVVGQTLNRLLVNVDNALTRMAESDRHAQFLTDASHELRTPLASILGYAELTRQESDQLPPMTEYALTRIEAESQRMSNLVSDLLLLTARRRTGSSTRRDRPPRSVCRRAQRHCGDRARTTASSPNCRTRPCWWHGVTGLWLSSWSRTFANARVHTRKGR